MIYRTWPIAPDHNAIYISLSGPCESPKGPGLWKCSSILLKDEESLEWVRETYSNTAKFYHQVTSKGLLRELIKMELGLGIRNIKPKYPEIAQRK